jgi:thioredoxin reductase (NADPH)
VCAGAKPTREEALKYYRGVIRAEGLSLLTYARLTEAQARNGRISCVLETRLGAETVTCNRLVLATGYFDHPNRLGVPGEDLPHVRNYFDEAHLSYGQNVVVVGGRNSAVEAALQLFRAGARVTLVYRGTEFPRSVKYWLKPDLENRIKAGELVARLGAQVESISAAHVMIRGADGAPEQLAADRVYALIGFHPDLTLFDRIGIAYDQATGRPVIDPDTLMTSIPGVYVAGSVTAGNKISEIFIENGRFDGDKIFGDAAERAAADVRYATIDRPPGE